MSTLEPGRLVWAVIADRNGYAKPMPRPAVVLGVPPEDRPDDPIAVTVCTTRVDTPMPADQVAIPWHSSGQSRTKLKRPTFAVCSWVAEIAAGDIHQFGGIVPPEQLAEIVAKVRALHAGGSPDADKP